jgi:hypothetical protein
MAEQAQTSYLQTGLSVGSAFGPWGSAFGAGLGALADIASKPAPPSNADSSYQNNYSFDNSGWNIGYKNSTISSDALTSNGQDGTQGSNDPWGLYSAGGGSSAKSQFANSFGFNDSGWNVAFPDATINSKAKTTNTQSANQKADAKPSMMGSQFSYVILLVGAVIALKWIQKK